MGKKKSINVSTISHPNSRKAKQLTKQIFKVQSRDKSKLQTYMKQNLLGEKLIWFRDNIEPNLKEMTPKILDELIENYLSRFDDEIEQIEVKHSIGQRQKRQHASREDILKSSKKREFEEYTTCGIELIDLFNSRQLELLKSWTGELRYLPNFILKRFSKEQLGKKIKLQANKIENDKSNENQTEPNISSEVIMETEETKN